MTSSQPPQPPGGRGEHLPGAQPADGGRPPQPGPPPGYGPPPQGFHPYGQPAASGGTTSFDLARLTVADYVIGGGTLLYLLWALLPWVSYGGGFYFYGGSVSGFGWSGLVTFSFLLFLLATAWAALPAFADVKVSFPRGWITAGLAGPGAVLTLIAWISTLTWGFSLWALLGLITAVAIAAFAFLRLLPELRNRPTLPGALAGAAQWANRQVPDLPGQFDGGQPGPGAPAGPPAAQPHQQPYAPPPPTAPPAGSYSPPGAGTGSASPGGPPAPGTEPHHPGTV
jgi:hypothetical protein